MSTVICHRENCKFRTGTMCSKPYIILYAPGICSEWFDKNGQALIQPFYSTIGEPYPTKPQSSNFYTDGRKNDLFGREKILDNTKITEKTEEGDNKNDIDGNGRDVSNNSELFEKSMDDSCEEQNEAGDRVD